MTFALILKLLIMASIFLSVLALALRAHWHDLFYLFRDWRLGLRAFVAMFVIVPAVAMALVALFDFPPPVEIALIALAFSPIPPLLPKKQLKAGGNESYVTGLLVGASLVSLVVTPLGMELAGVVFHIDTHVSPLSIALTLGIGVGAPLLFGLAGGRLLGQRAGPIADAIGKFSMILLLLCVVALLVAMAPAIGEVLGQGAIMALVAMILAGLAAGYALAGPSVENKVALSLAAATRHPGIAIGIAVSNFPDAQLAPAGILLFVLLNVIVAVPYTRFLETRTF